MVDCHQIIGMHIFKKYDVVMIFLFLFTMQADGYLARNYKQHSRIGTILDPLADKLLVGTMTVTLAIAGLLPCKSA